MAQTCSASTYSGRPCKSTVIDGNGLCMSHGGNFPKKQAPQKCPVQGCWRKVAGTSEVCADHAWTLDPQSVQARVSIAEREISNLRRSVEIERQKLLEISERARSAKGELVRLKREIESAAPIADDMQALQRAEKLAANDSAAAQAMVEIVKERRMQRREAKQKIMSVRAHNDAEGYDI